MEIDNKISNCYSSGICRACLTTENTKQMPDELSHMFTEITGLELVGEEGVPKDMCEECSEKLKDYSEFKDMCLQSNQWLKDRKRKFEISEQTTVNDSPNKPIESDTQTDWFNSHDTQTDWSDEDYFTPFNHQKDYIKEPVFKKKRKNKLVKTYLTPKDIKIVEKSLDAYVQTHKPKVKELPGVLEGDFGKIGFCSIGEPQEESSYFVPELERLPVNHVSSELSKNSGPNYTRKLVVKVLNSEQNELLEVDDCKVPDAVKKYIQNKRKTRIPETPLTEVRQIPNPIPKYTKKLVVKVLNSEQNELLEVDDCKVPDAVKKYIQNKSQIYPKGIQYKIQKSPPREPNPTKEREPVSELHYSDESSENEEDIAKIKIKYEIDKHNDLHEKLLGEDGKKLNLHRDLVIPPEIFEKEHLALKFLFDIRNLTVEEQKALIQDRKNKPKYLDKPYKCDLCYTGYRLKRPYDMHMMWHSPKVGKYICEVCQRRSPNKKRLYIHLQVHLHTYNCKYCPFVSNDRPAAVEHLRKLHGKPMKCKFCVFTTNCKKELKAHKQVRHPNEVICKFCGHSFESQTGLIVHNSQLHKYQKQEPSEELYCMECDISFMNLKAYQTHMKVSFQHGNCTEPVVWKEPSKKKLPSNGPIQICEWCGTTVRHWVSFYFHLKTVHPEKENTVGYECEICGKIIKCKFYQNHCQKYHNFAPKTHKCSECDKKFRWKKNLQKHLKHEHNVIRKDFTPGLARRIAKMWPIEKDTSDEDNEEANEELINEGTEDINEEDNATKDTFNEEAETVEEDNILFNEIKSTVDKQINDIDEESVLWNYFNITEDGSALDEKSLEIDAAIVDGDDTVIDVNENIPLEDVIFCGFGSLS